MGLVLNVFQTLVDMRILIFFLFCRNLGFFRKQDGGTLLARGLPWNAFVKHVVSFILPGMSVCFEDDWYRMSFRTHVNGSVQACPPVLSAPLLRHSMRHPYFLTARVRGQSGSTTSNLFFWRYSSMPHAPQGFEYGQSMTGKWVRALHDPLSCLLIL